MSKREARTNKLKQLWQKPAGCFISAVVLLLISYVLGSLAVDSGSVLQWFGTVVALCWGISRFIHGVIQIVSNR